MWRIYRREWLTVYTSDAVGEAGVLEVREELRQRYAGRVLPGELQITSMGWDSRANGQAFVPNLVSEWKSRSLAESHLAGDAVLVESGTAEERVLLDYGRKMLPG